MSPDPILYAQINSFTKSTSSKEYGLVKKSMLLFLHSSFKIFVQFILIEAS